MIRAATHGLNRRGELIEGGLGRLVTRGGDDVQQWMLADKRINDGGDDAEVIRLHYSFSISISIFAVKI